MTDEEDPALCFRRVDEVASVNPDDFLDRFERFGFYWFRSGATNLPQAKEILKFVQDHASECQKKWSVENLGSITEESKLKPSTIVSEKKEVSSSSSFYVSTIVHRQDEKAFNALHKSLPDLDVFQDLHESNSGSWLFVGHSDLQQQKRKRNMLGRAEHVDEVIHSGTYHLQVAGSKTWFIRPHPDLYCREELPELSSLPGAEQSDATKSWRLVIDVQEGDVFVLNTKIWYHYTEIPPSGWSISVAQDFFLPLPCPKDVAEGDVLFDEEDIPEEIPRSQEPNCALGEIESDELDDGESKIVLIAIKDIVQGEFLSIAEDSEEEGLCNADETVDPRAVAIQDFQKGQIVLTGDEIPNELPRSLEANCEFVGDGNAIHLKAVEDIPVGGIFCVRPEDDEEYEEVEVDLATGELRREA